MLLCFFGSFWVFFWAKKVSTMKWEKLMLLKAPKQVATGFRRNTKAHSIQISKKQYILTFFEQFTGSNKNKSRDLSRDCI